MDCGSQFITPSNSTRPHRRVGVCRRRLHRVRGRRRRAMTWAVTWHASGTIKRDCILIPRSSWETDGGDRRLVFSLQREERKGYGGAAWLASLPGVRDPRPDAVGRGSVLGELGEEEARQQSTPRFVSHTYYCTGRSTPRRPGLVAGGRDVTPGTRVGCRGGGT